MRPVLVVCLVGAVCLPLYSAGIPFRASVRGGGGSGKCTIEVEVEGSATIEITGDSGVLNSSSSRTKWRRFECNQAMPLYPNQFRFRGVDGRGRQDLLRPPAANGGTAVVSIQDNKRGTEGYTFDIEWNGGSGAAPAATMTGTTSAAPSSLSGKGREVKIQKTSLTKEQEIEIGKKAAAQVEQQMEVVHNAQAEAWLNRIGQKLAQTPEANAYPYYFKLVNEESINAFALPGGPMFVHTGLIKAADNESQVAAVLAHEMSHVALRHGAAQQGRASTWETILGVAGAAAGSMGGTSGGLIQQGVNLGGGLGVGSLLSKYSRDAERDADLNGARMAASAGYDPKEMARFFEKLNAQVGEAGRPKGLEKWLADHPDTLNRVKYVEEDIQYYPPKQYTAESGQFTQIKRLVGQIPPPKPKPGTLTMPVEGQARTGLPQGFTDLQTKDFAVAYPQAWKAGKTEQAGPLYIVPDGGIAKGQNGGVELIAGAMFDYYTPQGSTDLKSATDALLRGLQQGDKNMKVQSSQSVQLAGRPALMTKLTTRTSYTDDPNQTAFLFTVSRPAGLWMMVLAFPDSKLQAVQPSFRQMLDTVKFEE